MNLMSQMADINRRLLALKATRPVKISQLQILSEEWSFPLTLDPLGGANDEAIYKITIVCADNPIADVGFDGFPASVFRIVPAGIEWDISGNTAIAYMRLLNTAGTSSSMTLIVRAWGLNGLSATCERTL